MILADIHLDGYYHLKAAAITYQTGARTQKRSAGCIGFLEIEMISFKLKGQREK